VAVLLRGRRLHQVLNPTATPTRRAILARLALGEASVTELAEPFAISQPAVSKHLKILKPAGLIPRGRTMPMTIAEEDGVTTVTTLIDFGSKEARDAAVATGMTGGMEQSYQRLDRLFERGDALE
jgi:DNA-binding transcriptional ArsR family regulator